MKKIDVYSKLVKLKIQLCNDRHEKQGGPIGQQCFAFYHMSHRPAGLRIKAPYAKAIVLRCGENQMALFCCLAFLVPTAHFLRRILII